MFLTLSKDSQKQTLIATLKNVADLRIIICKQNLAFPTFYL